MDLNLIKASNKLGEAVRASVTAIRIAGSTTLTVDSMANWPAKFIATSGTLLADNTLSAVTVFVGHQSGLTIIIDSFAPGYTDAGNTVGQVVVLKPTTYWADSLTDFLGVSLADNGLLKAGAVTAPAIAAGAVANIALSTTAGEVGGAWLSWTPTFTGLVVTSSTVTARYTRIGKTILFRITIVLGGTNIPSGEVSFTLPATVVTGALGPNNFFPLGEVFFQNTNVTTISGVVRATSTTTACVMPNTSDGTYTRPQALSATIPFAWVVGNGIMVYGSYESA